MVKIDKLHFLKCLKPLLYVTLVFKNTSVM